MSMTHDAIIALGPDFQINTAIPERDRHLLRDRIASWARYPGGHDLYGVRTDGLWLGETGAYCYLDFIDGGSEYDPRFTIYTIEEILNTRPPAHTSHSSWSST